MQTAHTIPSDAPPPAAAMTEADAARYIGFSREFLRQSRMHGRRERRTPGPPFVKAGRTIRYLRADLDAWLWTHRRQIA